MIWIPQRQRDFMDDCFTIWQNGHRKTPTGKRRFLPRFSTGRWTLRYPFDVIENERWLRRANGESILHFDPHRELLFINVDNHWGNTGWRKIVMAICDERRQDYLCLSFDALRVAGLSQAANFLPIYRERICDFDFDRLWGRRRNTFPESTFRYTFRGQTKRFISGWDWNDRIPRYFLAELPKGAVATTMEAARDSLMPPAVHKAFLEDRKVVRQGDVFAIKTDLRERDLKKIKRTGALARHWQQSWMWTLNQGRPPAWVQRDTRSRQWQERFAIFENARDYAERLKIHGTAHTATEVLHTIDGAIYGKGKLIHMPQILGQNRVPDHQDIRLDDGRTGWWLFVRNTVPQRDGQQSNPF